MTHRVTVKGEDQGFSCSEDQNLLQGMRTFQFGAPMLEAIPVGCRGGGCGVCRIRVLSGDYETQKMSRKHVHPEDQAIGMALACRVYPRSDLTVEVMAPQESLSEFEAKEYRS